MYQRWLSAKPTQRSGPFAEALFLGGNDTLKDLYFRCEQIHYQVKELAIEHMLGIEQSWRDLISEDFPMQIETLRSDKGAFVFTGSWDKDRLAALGMTISLQREVRAELQRIMPIRNYIMGSDFEEDETLIWILEPVNQIDSEASGSVLQQAMQHLTQRKLFTIITPEKNHLFGLLSLGFIRLRWADCKVPGRPKYYVVQQDARRKDLFHLLLEQYAAKPSLTLKERIKIVKQMLVQYHELESDESLLLQLKTILHMPEDRSAGEIASNARQATVKGLRHLAKSSPKHQPAVQAIDYTYIQRVSTNEEIAIRMHLSLSTYYRYLRNGIELLALYFEKVSDTLC